MFIYINRGERFPRMSGERRGGSDINGFLDARDNNRVYIRTEEKVIVGWNSFVGRIHSDSGFTCTEILFFWMDLNFQKTV